MGKRIDYDSDEFYDEVFALALQGATDSEIAMGLDEKFETGISAPRFCCMVNGNYEGWTEEENIRRSERLCKVLAHAREKINMLVRGRYLKAALGGIKVKSTTTTRRKLKIGGNYTENEEIITTETNSEMSPNMQALGTWLYHHDPTWRKIERKAEEDDADVPKAKNGVSISSWIDKENEGNPVDGIGI